MIRRSGGEQRAGGDQSFAPRIDGQVESFETARAEKEKIAPLREDHLVNSEGLADADDGKADAASDPLAVGHDEFQVFFFLDDPDLLENFRAYPGIFAACVDENAGQGHSFSALNYIFDPASDGEGAHFAST